MVKNIEQTYRPLLEAVAFATRAHQGQMRKDRQTPYVSHAYRVCLNSGNVTKPSVCVKVDTYPVRVEDGMILVALEGDQEKAA